MFCKVKDGQVIAQVTYPYNVMGSKGVQFSNISTVDTDTLVQNGIYPVQYTQELQASEYTTLMSVKTIVHNDHVEYCSVYQYMDLDNLRIYLNNKINSYRDSFLYTPLTLDGVVYDTTQSTVQTMMLYVATMSDTDTVHWRTQENVFVELSKEKMNSVLVKIRERTSELYNESWKLKTDLENLTSAQSCIAAFNKFASKYVM